MNVVRIGTRGSPLALWQAHHVSDLLRAAHSNIEIQLVEIQTEGDQVRNVPLAQMGGYGVFTKAIQDAVLDGRVDIAVHSLKDLPTIVVENLTLAAVPARESTGDAFISLKHRSFADLPPGAVVASSSLRRRAQILHRRPDLRLVDIRGNVETRLRKVGEQNLDATILAEAGLKRLGLTSHITEVLDRSWMLPAVGQGALGLECRTDDAGTRALLAKLDHPQSHAEAFAERAMLIGLGGGCQVPIGADSRVDGERFILRGVVLPPDGSQRIEATLEGTVQEPEKLGRDVAERLMSSGARQLLC